MQNPKKSLTLLICVKLLARNCVTQDRIASHRITSILNQVLAPKVPIGNCILALILTVVTRFFETGNIPN